MRVLHLFSNAKWTGPAEPALNTCLALRRLGVEADFACAPDAGESINKVVETARDRGIEPILHFHLSKHLDPIKNFLDSRRLIRFVRERGYDLIHCHLDNDHRIAIPTTRRLGVPLIRSNYYGEGFDHAWHHGRLLRHCRFLIEPSRRAFEADQRRFGFPAERMRVVPGAVDTERFDSAREVPDARRWLDIPPDAFVAGIVARMQRRRRYEDLFEAVARLVPTPGRPVYLIVVGRGTHQETVGFKPARRLGIEERVRFAGYVDGENYVGMLKAFDIKVFLIPGTDGTCRAVREAMAMGKPVIAARRGMLDEIVDDGVNGLLCDGSAEGLYAALSAVREDRAKIRVMGAEARRKAIERFSLEAQASAIWQIYEEVLTDHPTAP